MTMRTSSHSHTASCPAISAKAVVSYVFSNAVRFYGVLRFYYYYYFTEPSLI